MIKILKNLKKSKFWKKIIDYFFYPILIVFWKYILNIQAKILAYIWNFKKKEYFNLGKNDKLLIKDDNSFKNLANDIFAEASILLEDSKKEILSEEYQKELEKSNLARAEKPYQKSLYNKLSADLKEKIINFASSDKLISTATRYMGIFPILTRVDVGHIIPRENSSERAAMLWHKDNFGFKSLDLFMIINNVDEGNGPLYVMEKKIHAGVLKSFINQKNVRTGERGKVPIREFDKVFTNEKIIKLDGNSGNALLIDSFSAYHRGGYCKNRERIMMRFCYQSVDALCDESFYKEKDYFHFDERILNNGTLNIFKKYLFFKKPSYFIKYISKLMTKFYSLIEYKYN